jgi:hypothetical protein
MLELVEERNEFFFYLPLWLGSGRYRELGDGICWELGNGDKELHTTRHCGITYQGQHVENGDRAAGLNTACHCGDRGGNDDLDSQAVLTGFHGRNTQI